MKKVLLVQPSLQPKGGGNAVAVWIIEALKRECEVSVLTWEPVSVTAINRFYGTSLDSFDFNVYSVSRLMRGLADLDPDPHSVQKSSLLMRLCKKMKNDYDVVITANGETDLGCRGIQYIHYPSFNRFEPICRQFVDLPWYRRLWGLIQGRYRPWMAISGYSFDRMKENITLVNSDWTGCKFREFYGGETVTLYPPVPGEFHDIPWEQRENGFVCIGRISEEKRLEKIIDILSKVRSQGEDTHLHIIGTRGYNMDYYKKVVEKARENASWVSLSENLPRPELVRLVSKHKYGIHGMTDEHFGIAVAERVRAGCIVFVPNDGGRWR